ncbi:MAG: right-handed parallel beta-helix repeat-containing protein [Planctomycetaceae bacterium]
MPVRIVLLFLTFATTTAATAAADGLPGARRVIEAAEFKSIQAAFDAVPEDGGLVRLPAGRFEITEPLVLQRGDVRIEGAGAATNIINLNEDGRSAIIVQHPDGQHVKREERLWRVSLASFRITGNDRSGHGIEAVQIEEIFLHGLSVSYNGGDGLRLDRCYEDPRVSDCLVTYNKGVGLNLIGCHDIVVSSNQFEENNDALHCSDGYNLCMTGNCLDDHLGRGVLIENTYGSVLSGNMIEECAGTAVTLDRDCYGITIGANVIAHNGAGVDLRDAHGCAISANTFTIMKNFALRIGPNSGRIAVTGNAFCNSYLGDGKFRRREGDRDAGGLVLESTQNVTVTGNTFTGLMPKTITTFGDSRGTIFSSNIVVDDADEQ